jgi:hypothetical protein
MAGDGWPGGRSLASLGGMTAQPVFEPDPDDPDEILRVLSAKYRPQFLGEYDAAVTATRRPEEYRHLRGFLRTWRLIALATSSPGYESRVREAADSTGTARRGTPIEDIVPDWAERVEAARRRMAR